LQPPPEKPGSLSLSLSLSLSTRAAAEGRQLSVSGGALSHRAHNRRQIHRSVGTGGSPNWPPCAAAGAAGKKSCAYGRYPMSRRFAGQRNQPGLSAGSGLAFERCHAASVRCARARRGTSAWRVRTQWPASVVTAASWVARDLSPRCNCCSSALGSVPAPPPRVVNVCARAGRGQCAIEGRSRCDRSGACGHRARERAHPVGLFQPRRAARTLLLAMLASLSRAFVCRLLRTYSERL